MARRRPDDEELKSMLSEGHFGPTTELPPGDPVDTTAMLLDIERIDTYERNPRQERNPLHDEIKDSIRHHGLQQPLVITRRPGADRYLVKAGGNTRLQVLRELHDETGEARFAQVHCLFEPWRSESEVLTAHLIENDTRGELSFIDKARAVRELRALIESESGESLTQERLAAALRERGYRLERSILSRMDYAVDVLLPRIPEALRTGLGQPQIQRIRRLERASRQIWCAQEIGSGPDFDQVFAILLGRYDGVEWQFDRLRRALEKEIAERTGEELPRISLELDAVMGGYPATVRRELRDLDAEHEAKQAPASSESASDGRAAAMAPSPSADRPPVGASESGQARDVAPEAAPGLDAAAPEVETPLSHEGSAEARSTTPAIDADPLVGTPQRDAGPSALRACTRTLASRIAKRSAMGEIVVPIGEHGAGYLVDFVFTGEQDDAQTKLARATLWWFLATVAEQFHGPRERVARHVPAAWSAKPIGQVITDPDTGRHDDLLAEYALIGIGPLMGPLVFAAIDERDWTDLIELLQAYRRLKHSVIATGASLWSELP